MSEAFGQPWLVALLIVAFAVNFFGCFVKRKTSICVAGGLLALLSLALLLLFGGSLQEGLLYCGCIFLLYCISYCKRER